MSAILPVRQTVANIYNPQNQTKEQLIEGFVVRQQLFKKLFKVIKDAKMEVPEQHYLLLGRRGMGKTTLLLRLAYEIQNDSALNGWLIPLVFNEEEYGIRTLFKFWERVMELLEEKHPAFRFEEGALRQISRQHATDHDAYEKALFEWLSTELKRNGKKLILFMDNFGDMARKLSDTEAHRLRKILQTSSDIRIFAASSVVLEAFYKYDHPFYEFFKTEELKGLNESETRELLLSLGQHYKKEEVRRIIEQNPGRVEALRRIAGGVIRTIVLLFEIFSDDEDGSAFHDLQVILDRGVTNLYKHRMDDLSDQQQAIVEAIALNWDAISVKEIAEQTRLESKIVSAQLSTLEKNGIVEKRATRTKNHLYLIAERFFNIWFLMRLGRKSDQKRVLWLVRFFEDWCDRTLMKRRAERHVGAIRGGRFDAEAAFYMTQAMAGVKDLDMVSRHKMLEETRSYLSGKDSELAQSLSQSDLDTALEAIEKWYAGEQQEALHLLKTARSFTGSKINTLLEKENDVPTFQDMEQSVSQSWQEAMDDFACDIGWVFNDDLQKAATAWECFKRSAQSGYPRAFNAFGWLYQNEHKDLAKAEEWWLKAAKKGNSGAMFNLGWLYQNEYKDLSKAEEWWVKAADLGNIYGLNSLAWHFLKEKKEKNNALERAAGAYQKDLGDSYCAHTYACTLLWHSNTVEALEVARNFMWDKKLQEIRSDDFFLFFTLLIAKNQTQYLYDLFTSPQGIEHEFKDRFKPIWYAILKKLDHPDFLRMGDELSQTVEEVLARSEQLAVDYA